MSNTLHQRSMETDNDGTRNEPSSCQNKTSSRTYATVVRKTMANLPKAKKGKDNEEQSLHANAKSQSFERKYKIVSSKKSKYRLEHHTKLVKMVSSVMAVYTARDNGHNTGSINLWD